MHEPLKGADRLTLLEELHKQYAKASTWQQRWTLWRKRWAWYLVVRSARAIKRLTDILIASAALIILSPLFLVIALLIKFSDWGPIFYVSTRVGKWGREFPFPKFRSMKIQADQEKKELMKQNIHQSVGTFKMKKDPRTTWIGKWIRRASIDELPQLWSVILGHMSLVGPRPPLPEEVATYTLKDRRRLDVRPGITCIWQISGRSDIPFDKQAELDKEYIESRSLLLDLTILVKTIPAVIMGKGAY
ncbi:MAG: glycosyl transferase [Waddliaceae bacterium]|nr:glycosyl transferase [Waddliaceae bacterium]